MNERIRDLQIQAFAECKTFEDSKVRTDEVFKRFAELIVSECVSALDEADIGSVHHRECLFEHFGIEETKGWVCPRCGVDRTKNVCPKGYTATIEGKCPMIAVAQ